MTLAAAQQAASASDPRALREARRGLGVQWAGTQPLAAVFGIGRACRPGAASAADPAKPRFKTATGTETAVSAGMTGWAEDIVRLTRQIRDGEGVADAPWLLVATPTLADPTRAPAGHHTVKLIVPCSVRAPSATGVWDDVKESFAQMLLEKVRIVAPNLTPDVIKAMLIRSDPDCTGRCR